MDYRAMFDRDYLGAWDLVDREGNKIDVTVEIREVRAGELTGQGGRKAKKPIVWFTGKEKGLALNRTNGKTIATLYGNDTRSWPGKRVTLYATQTQMGGDTVDCIRVRPQIPNGARRSAARPPQQQREQDDRPDPGPNGETEPPEPGSDG